MDTLKIKIENIKNIKSADIELPLESGVYALVGTNGCGKSTILLVMAQLISRHYLGTLKKEDYSLNSKVTFTIESENDEWTFDPKSEKWKSSIFPKILKFNGMYEGSLFYGTRFNDSRKIDRLFEEGKLNANEIVPADEYIIQKLSYILHGDHDHYCNLKRVKNKYITERIGVNNTPYFNEVNENLISQYRMSSGECMLISLLHFIYNSLVRKSLPINKKILVLIDEIELALHPIAVSRLIELLNELLKNNKNLTVILTSHSPEVIRKIKPSNLHKVMNKNGVLTVDSNCYPSYLIRDVYDHDGFDFLLLVEDDLAKCVVEKVILKNNLRASKLIHVVPVGGWKNVLYLHTDLLKWNVLGFGKQIISVLDGDVRNIIGEEYQDVRKLFLPINSIEKFLYNSIIQNPQEDIIKLLNDKYFTIKSLSTLVKEYKLRFPNEPSNPDKKFYFRLKKDLEERHINESYFITNLCDDLMTVVDFTSFASSLAKNLR